MARVTVCFTGLDTDGADRIAEWATQKGYDVDRLTDDASVSDAAAFRLRLLETDALLAIMTPAWMASPACRSAFREAQLLRRPVFPVIVSHAGEFVIGSNPSRLTLSENEAVGLEWLTTAIDASANATLKAKSDHKTFVHCT